tara:strand:+ start:2705 stop:2893 length:189 start_codon:yes stop_codon:yes gene_type:complete
MSSDTQLQKWLQGLRRTVEAAKYREGDLQVPTVPTDHPESQAKFLNILLDRHFRDMQASKVN